jgi:hypothetical protein
MVDQSGSRPAPQQVRPAAVQETPMQQEPMQQEPAQREAPDSGRASARAALDAALAGVELTATDRRFLARLSQWDKRTATMVASLVQRARESGQGEAVQPDVHGCLWCGR